MADNDISRNEIKKAANLVSLKLNRQLTSEEIFKLRFLYRGLRRDVADKIRAVADQFFDMGHTVLPKAITNPAQVDEYWNDSLRWTEGESKYTHKTISSGKIERTRVIDGDEVCPDSDPYMPYEGSRSKCSSENSVSSTQAICALEKIQYLLEHDRATFDDVGLRRSYISLDSYFRNVGNDSDPFTRLFYDVKLLTTKAETMAIDTYKELERVVDVTVGPFRIPLVTSSTNRFLKIRMAITELYPISYGLLNQPGYHFTFDAQTIGSYIYLTPAPGFDRIIMYFPIPLLSKLTLIFYDPYNAITFEPDRGVYTVSNTNPAVLTGPTTFLTTGDFVTISGFVSGNYNIDTAINSNLPVIVISSTSFSVPVDATAMLGPIYGANVFFSDRRIDPPLIFKCME